MKRLLLSCIALFALTAPLLTRGQSFPFSSGTGLHYTPDEVSEWRSRAVSGPYRSLGDTGVNTPGDWNRIVTFSDQFKARPYVVGHTGADSLTLWNGYDGGADTQAQYPVWQGVKMKDAAFRFLLTGDTSYGNPVRRCLLRQMDVSRSNRARYADPGYWPPYDNSRANGAPTYESGFWEVQWLDRMLTSADYIRPLLSPTELDSLAVFFTRSANYFASQIHRNIGAYLPGRLTGSYSTRTAYFSAAGNRMVKAPFNLYEKADGEGEVKAGYPGGLVYTHVNADGSLGYPIPVAATTYNNRAWGKMPFIVKASLVASSPSLRTTLQSHVRAFAREWLMFSVFPDGTYGEYNRNGDYSKNSNPGNPSEGAMWYGAINLQAIVECADLLARRGDSSIYTLKTRDGIASTLCTTKDPDKTLFLVLNRYADNHTGTRPIFYKSVLPGNRIDNYCETGDYRFDPYAAYDGSILSVANRYYRSERFFQVYTRKASGSLPYPASGIAGASSIWVPFSNPRATWPGALFQFGRMEGVEVYGRPKTWATVTGSGRQVAGPRNFFLTVSDGGRTLQSVTWRQVGGSPLRLEARKEVTCVVASMTPLAPVPVGTYDLRVTLVASNGERVDQPVSLTVEP